MSTSRQHTEAVMQGLASGADSILNGDQDDPLNTGRKYGFVLLVADHVAWAREHFWPEFNRRNGL